MPRCKNNYDCKYTGKEPSPLGLGISATGWNVHVGMKKKGKDGNKWELIEYVTKSGPVKYKYKWQKYNPDKKEKKVKPCPDLAVGKKLDFTIEWKIRKYKNSVDLPKAKLEKFLGSKFMKNTLDDWLWSGVTTGMKRYNISLKINSVKGKMKGDKLFTIVKATVIDGDQGDVVCPNIRSLFAGLRDVWLHHLYAGGLLTKMYKNVSELDIEDIIKN